MSSIIESMVQDGCKIAIKELSKKKNKKVIRSLTNKIISYIFQHIGVYLYTIISVLILLFVLNLVQFFFYITYLKTLFASKQIISTS